MTGNRQDRELDIVLRLGQGRQIIRNLTKGFDQDLGFEYIVHAGRALEHGALDVVVVQGRPAGLLRPHREGHARSSCRTC